MVHRVAWACATLGVTVRVLLLMLKRADAAQLSELDACFPPYCELASVSCLHQCLLASTARHHKLLGLFSVTHIRTFTPMRAHASTWALPHANTSAHAHTCRHAGAHSLTKLAPLRRSFTPRNHPMLPSHRRIRMVVVGRVACVTAPPPLGSVASPTSTRYTVHFVGWRCRVRLPHQTRCVVTVQWGAVQGPSSARCAAVGSSRSSTSE